jgi:hypothetical protein
MIRANGGRSHSSDRMALSNSNWSRRRQDVLAPRLIRNVSRTALRPRYIGRTDGDVGKGLQQGRIERG